MTAQLPGDPSTDASIVTVTAHRTTNSIRSPSAIRRQPSQVYSRRGTPQLSVIPGQVRRHIRGGDPVPRREKTARRRRDDHELAVPPVAYRSQQRRRRDVRTTGTSRLPRTPSGSQLIRGPLHCNLCVRPANSSPGAVRLTTATPREPARDITVGRAVELA